MKLNERRFINTSLVREMCIKDDLYTRGTVEEYCQMFDMCKTESIIDIATDIMEHSDVQRKMKEYGCGRIELLEHIASCIINECTYTTVIIDY